MDATFGYDACFDNATFGDNAYFSATFGDYARFTGATFGDNANFAAAIFGKQARFIGAIFGDQADFTNATFGDDANFTAATFGDRSVFISTIFGDWADFSGASFGTWLSFTKASLRGRARFEGWSVEQQAKHLEQYSGGVDKKEQGSRKTQHADSRPSRFQGVHFDGATFYDTVSFCHRSFDGPANFTDTRFYRPPDIDGAANVGRVDLTGATIQFVPPTWPWWKPHWTDDPANVVRLRAIRKIAEETKNHDFERDLYIEERKAERGVIWSRLWPQTKAAAKRLTIASLVLVRPHRIARPAMLNWSDPARVRLWRAWRKRARLFLLAAGQLASHALWIVVMAAYWALADYGRSFVRPLFWLVASWAFFRWRYEDVFAPVLQKLRAMGDLQATQIPQYHDAIHMVALGHAVPFVGAFTVDTDIKKFLLCGNASHCALIPPAGYQGLVITQNLDFDPARLLRRLSVAELFQDQVRSVWTLASRATRAPLPVSRAKRGEAG